MGFSKYQKEPRVGGAVHAWIGIIVGSGTYNDGPGGLSDGMRGFVLDGSSLLVPEPASLAAMLVPALLLARRRQ